MDLEPEPKLAGPGAQQKKQSFKKKKAGSNSMPLSESDKWLTPHVISLINKTRLPSHSLHFIIPHQLSHPHLSLTLSLFVKILKRWR